jgi:hypothetical protein
MESGWVGLAEAVQVLREELTVAMENAEGESLRFELGPVEMEFAVTVRKEGGGSAGVQLGVVSIGAKGGVSSDSAHRVKLVLTPKDLLRGGRAPEIGSRVDEIPDR